MTIQAVFTMTTPGGEVRLFVNGTAYAKSWCAEFSDWQIEHIFLDNIEGEDGDGWPLQMFSDTQLQEMKRGLLLAARRKSATNPAMAANLRSLLNLPKFEGKTDFVG